MALWFEEDLEATDLTRTPLSDEAERGNIVREIECVRAKQEMQRIKASFERKTEQIAELLFTGTEVPQNQIHSSEFQSLLKTFFNASQGMPRLQLDNVLNVIQKGNITGNAIAAADNAENASNSIMAIVKSQPTAMMRAPDAALASQSNASQNLGMQASPMKKTKKSETSKTNGGRKRKNNSYVAPTESASVLSGTSPASSVEGSKKRRKSKAKETTSNSLDTSTAVVDARLKAPWESIATPAMAMAAEYSSSSQLASMERPVNDANSRHQKSNISEQISKLDLNQMLSRAGALGLPPLESHVERTQDGSYNSFKMKEEQSSYSSAHEISASPKIPVQEDISEKLKRLVSNPDLLASNKSPAIGLPSLPPESYPHLPALGNPQMPQQAVSRQSPVNFIGGLPSQRNESPIFAEPVSREISGQYPFINQRVPLNSGVEMATLASSANVPALPSPQMHRLQQQQQAQSRLHQQQQLMQHQNQLQLQQLMSAASGQNNVQNGQLRKALLVEQNSASLPSLEQLYASNGNPTNGQVSSSSATGVDVERLRAQVNYVSNRYPSRSPINFPHDSSHATPSQGHESVNFADLARLSGQDNLSSFQLNSRPNMPQYRANVRNSTSFDGMNYAASNHFQ